MDKRQMGRSLLILQWTLGLVVFYESCSFVFSRGAAHAFSHTGLPAWLRPALGGVEALAAILFLIPPTVIVAGYSLVVIFLLAVVIHLLHHAGDASGLLVYAAATLAVIAWKSGRQTEGH